MDSKPAGMAGVFVSFLWEVPALAPVLAKAHAQEWGHLYVNWNEQVALSDFQAERQDTDFPTTWVAHHPSHGPLGSVSLVRDDLPGRPGFNPWLASLLVFPQFRGRGFGSFLVREALAFLCRRNYSEAFLFTENRAAYFAKFHFTFLEQAQAEGHGVTVMKWTRPAAKLLL